MAGYSSDDGDYYSDGGWEEEDDGGYYSDDDSEQQEFGNDDNVSESHEGTGREDSHEEQDDDEGSHDEDKGTEPEELNDHTGHQVRGCGVPGNVILKPGQDGPQQTMSGDTFKERSTGRGGCKYEYKRSTTVTTGNKGGFSEYHREERFRTIEFGKSSGNSSSGLTNKKK